MCHQTLKTKLLILILGLGFSCVLFAADLYVTSDSVANPSAVQCPSGTPCHIDDALRIAEENSADDTIILLSPSTFLGADSYQYYPQATDLDRDLTIRVDGGAGLFDGNGQNLHWHLESRDGDISLIGLTIRNSETSWDNTIENAVLRIAASGTGDIDLQSLTVEQNQRYVFNGFNPGVAGGFLTSQAGAVSVAASRFQHNQPGGLWASAPTVTVEQSSFLENTQNLNEQGQGGLRVQAHSVQIIDNDFRGNTCWGASYGGAMSIILAAELSAVASADSEIGTNRIIDNTGTICTGGVYLDRSAQTINPTGIGTVVFTGNLLKANQAQGGHGGAWFTHLDDKSRLVAQNNLIFDNSTVNSPFGSATHGSALYALLSNDAKLYFVNNTVVENPLAASSTNSAAIHIALGSYQNQLEIYNNILFDNPTTVHLLDDSDLRIEGDGNAAVTVRYNKFGFTDYFGGGASTGLDVSDNVFSVAGFADAANEDYHLADTSALIDAGSVAAPNLPVLDMDGQSRVLFSSVDIGADEFSGVQRHLVTLSKIGSGDGSVATLPSGIACGVGCSSDSGLFDQGTTVGFLALADQFSEFVGWSGDCGGSMAGAALFISGTHTCTAEFQPKRYQIVLQASGTENGTVSASYGPALNWIYPLGGNQRTVSDIPPGSDVTITADATDINAYVFMENCEAQGGTLFNQATNTVECAFTNIQSDLNLQMAFEFGVILFPNRTLSVVKSGSGTGLVQSTPGGIDCGGVCSHDYFVGTEVTLEAIPDAGSQFGGWIGDCAAFGSSATITMDDTRSCEAIFGPTHTVTLNLGGSGAGNYADIFRATGGLYPQGGNTYAGIYPLGSNLLFNLNGNNAVVSVTGCSDAGQSMVLAGNNTATASCTIGNLTQDTVLDVTYTPQQSTLTVVASGTGPGTLFSDIGGISFAFPASSSGQSSPLNYGQNVTVSATGVSGTTVHWGNCTGPGSIVTGEGTTQSTCQIGIYQATQVDVEFRVDPADIIFMDDFTQ